MIRSSSINLFERAQTVFPGGVNSPVRAFKSVGGDPFYVARGEGPFLVDVDGNRYIDCVLSWGPLVMGHAHSYVVEAINNQAKLGTSFGACHAGELQLAAKIQQLLPSIEMLRFVNSGTEAGMSVIRLARAFTGRRKILKFSGCYHGHIDDLLAKAGSGVATLGLPDSAGVPDDSVAKTLIATFNDISSVESAFLHHSGDIAAVIVEPVVGNAGFILPEDNFLRKLRDLTSSHNSLLIFDEVMTGFRVNRSGAQIEFDIKPDLTMLGKVIGGGLPVGAYGGRRDIMSWIAPLGPVYQAGTLSGNPLAMAAGSATLDLWGEAGNFENGEKAAGEIISVFNGMCRRYSIPITTSSLGSMLGIFFHEGPVRSFEDAKQSNKDRYLSLFHGLLKRGVYIPPSPFEAWFVSALHHGSVLDQLCSAISETIAEISS